MSSLKLNEEVYYRRVSDSVRVFLKNLVESEDLFHFSSQKEKKERISDVLNKIWTNYYLLNNYFSPHFDKYFCDEEDYHICNDNLFSSFLKTFSDEYKVIPLLINSVSYKEIETFKLIGSTSFPFEKFGSFDKFSEVYTISYRNLFDSLSFVKLDKSSSFLYDDIEDSFFNVEFELNHHAIVYFNYLFKLLLDNGFIDSENCFFRKGLELKYFIDYPDFLFFLKDYTEFSSNNLESIFADKEFTQEEKLILENLKESREDKEEVIPISDISDEVNGNNKIGETDEDEDLCF